MKLRVQTNSVPPRWEHANQAQQQPPINIRSKIVRAFHDTLPSAASRRRRCAANHRTWTRILASDWPAPRRRRPARTAGPTPQKIRIVVCTPRDACLYAIESGYGRVFSHLATGDASARALEYLQWNVAWPGPEAAPLIHCGPPRRGRPP